MKKTLSILAVAALSLGVITSYAEEVVRYPYGNVQSPVVSQVIAPGATLVNTETGKVVVYNLNDSPQVEPPFDISKGHILWSISMTDSSNKPLNLSLDDVIVKTGDTLLLDFTANMNNLSGPITTEYMVVMFRGAAAFGNNFAEWYSTNEIPIIARFNNGDYVAYAIDGTCDLVSSGPASTYGGLVFFNKENVAEKVLKAEVDPGTITPASVVASAVPEPTTTTLSLLALAGLAARHRRK